MYLAAVTIAAGITGKPAVGMATLRRPGARCGDPAARGRCCASGTVEGGRGVSARPVESGRRLGAKAADGRNGLAEVAAAGVKLRPYGPGDWSLAASTRRSRQSARLLDAAAAHGLHCWLVARRSRRTCRPGRDQPSANEQLLTQIVDGVARATRRSRAYKGIDEPRNPFRGANWIRPPGSSARYEKLKALDPTIPVVIIQAPRSTGRRS